MQPSLSKAGIVQDTVNFPVHLKNFNLSQLRQLCKELRSDIVHTVSKTGGEQTPESGYIAPWKARECQHTWGSVLDILLNEGVQSTCRSSGRIPGCCGIDCRAALCLQHSR